MRDKMRDKKIKQKPNRTQILWFFEDFKHDVFCISELLGNQQQKINEDEVLDILEPFSKI